MGEILRYLLIFLQNPEVAIVTHSRGGILRGGISTRDVLKLAEEIKKDISKKYGIILEPEVQYIEF